MARDTTTHYGADIDTVFQWATADGDFFDRELDLSFLARALERHDHSAGRGLAITRLATGIVNSASFAAGAVNTAALGDLQVTSGKLATNAVQTDKINALAVTTPKLANLGTTTEKIADGAITPQKLADGAITPQKLAAGAAVSNIGYTPVNRAGDNITGPLAVTVNAAGVVALTLRSTVAGAAGYGFGILNAAGNSWEVLVSHDTFHCNITLSVGALSVNTINGGTPWTSTNDGAGSGLDADLLDGQHGSYYSDIGVPLGAIVMFETQGELTAAGARWTAFAGCAGRMPVGVGTTGGWTFVQGGQYGVNWTPVTGLSSAAMGGPSETFPVVSGGVQVASAGHTHAAGAINGQGATWHPPMRAMVFAKRI